MDPKTAMYIAQGIHGLAYGMILFLIASGLNIIFGMMGILNLAHASFFMLSAYFSYQFLIMTGNFWAALLLAPLTTAFFGILVERFLLRKVHGLGHMAELILTVGVSLVILGRGEDLLGHREPPSEDSPHSGGINKYRRHGLPGVSAFRYRAGSRLYWLLWPYCSTRPAWAKLCAPRSPTRTWSPRWESTHPWSSCSFLASAHGLPEWLESPLPRS